MDFDSDQSLKDWAKDKPLSILQLDPADRAVLRIADETIYVLKIFCWASSQLGWMLLIAGTSRFQLPKRHDIKLLARGIRHLFSSRVHELAALLCTLVSFMFLGLTLSIDEDLGKIVTFVNLENLFFIEKNYILNVILRYPYMLVLYQHKPNLAINGCNTTTKFK
ncbi:microtubule-actin cross-linking factor 1 isoform X6 [Aphis craccivora]|uniref:Microtubule-actin cross-linking factor 1 isoform X6 n=1 Tax=Aphis craccivora TaxID=307492 RepID=A0A6G0ZGK7_APHCR|nr:microtubule-actin cross-linking factor 1 isoform X6 [Aphis craccivora]